MSAEMTAGVDARTGSVDGDIPVAPAVVVNSTVSPPPVSPVGRRKYRGGFSSSICDLFRNPQRRTDCCAVACCGVLSSDRTRYLLTGERPPSVFKRVAMYLIVPVLFFFAIVQLSPPPASDDEDEDGGAPDNNYDNGDQQDQSSAAGIVLLLFYVYIIFLCAYGRTKRVQIRQDLIAKLYARELEENRGTATTNAAPSQLDLLRQVNAHQYDSRSAHRRCWCYNDDAMYSVDDLMEEEDVQADMCSCIWNCLSKVFCGALCRCWCQCCGICAIGQEEREVNRLVPKSQRLIDYATFQPFAEYFPAIENLRITQNESFLEHVGTLSALSIKLLKSLGIVVLGLLVFALTDIDSNFTFENMCVLLMTLFQAFFIEYLVHWRWNKFDISFDAVVKYFACGFLLTTPMAIVFEMIISTLASLLMYAMISIAISQDAEMQEEIKEDQEAAAKELAKSYPGIFLLYFFINAFAVAALVEEMVKYFGFWMVEHPDLMSAEDLTVSDTAAASTNGDESADRSNGEQNGTVGTVDTARQANRNLKSIGSGITVAMVSVALGFACCENLIYVFLYSPPSVGMEISTLLLRSLFPVHPLCAAIQSIGVCRRDLEGDKSCQLGKIVFPAVLLHGSFDFALMAIAFLDALEHLDDDESENEEEISLSDAFVAQLPGMVVGMILVVLGILYYVKKSRAQSSRLESVHSSTIDDAALLL